MDSMKLVARRLDTSAPTSMETTSTVVLPDTLVSDQIGRLAVCSAVAAGLWSYGVVMDTIVRPAVGVAVPRAGIGVELAAIAASLIMFVYVRYAPHARARKIDAGLVYIVLNAAAVALLNTFTGLAAVSAGRGLSWNTVVILVAAMIVPATPRRMLAASLAAASMDPLVAWISHLRGLPVASLANTLVFYAPNFACAAVATVPSRVLQRIGRRLRRAQEMGSYRLVELLGRGGMGEVWRAEHRLLARGAAVKLVRPELLGAGTALEARSLLLRFEHEAQATALLSSPHTIRVFDFGITADQTFYYVMELLQGRDLQSLVREFGPLPAERAHFLLRQLCHSLAEAHAAGLVHRDVTPSNVYVCRMGLDYDFVKVLDFGLVKLNGRRSLEPRADGGARTTGTPAFMAPEIILGAEIDQRADVYAIGCVAYYVLTGQTVFEADDPSDMFLRHLQERPIPPSRRTEMPIPSELDALVLACLEKDPQRRPRDAAAVLTMLDRYRPREAWDNASASAWWERHLVSLTGPSVMTTDATAAVTVA